MKPLLAIGTASLALFLGSFSSYAAAPIAATVGASNITISTATFHGLVTPRSASTKTYFQWGTTTNYGNVTATQTLAAGSVAIPVQQSVGGLAPLTTYHFRTVARNAYGVRYGSNIQFRTVGPPPTVATLSATNVTPSSAILQGTVNPNGAANTAVFEWGTTTNYGMTTAPVSLPSGSNALAIQAGFTNLVGGTTYHYRIVATNSGGVSLSSDGVFTTSLAAPSVTTQIPSDITTNSATLRGTVNPNGLSTVALFQWGPTTNYGTTTATQVLAAAGGLVSMQANLSSLTEDTPYHYRLVASNALGVSYGDDIIVTPTLLLYLYAGESWTYVFHDLPFIRDEKFESPISPYGAIIRILPDTFPSGSSLKMEAFGSSTNEIAIASTLLSAPATDGAVIPEQSFGQGTLRFTMLTGSVVVASLTIATYIPHPGGRQYYSNSMVPTRIQQPALIATQYLSDVSFFSATVHANVDARNLATGIYVQWGTTTNYGSATSAVQLDRDYIVAEQFTLTNLVAGAAYHVRTVATNSAGVSYGKDLVLATLFPAAVITQPATSLRSTSAVLNATVSLNGFSSSAFFEWGTTTNYDRVTPVQSLGNPITTTNVSAQLIGLNPQTIYHGRAVAYALGVTNFGADVAFNTVPPPANSVITNCVTDDVRGAIERGGTVTFACDGVLALSNQIEIASGVILDASGHAITFSGSNVTRLFKVFPGGMLALTNITLADGRDPNGGAIYSEGIVVAQDCRFLGNSAIGRAGTNGVNGTNGTSAPTAGQSGENGSPGGDALGGAILNYGMITLARCSFANNTAVGGAGGKGGDGGHGGSTGYYRDFGRDGGDGGAGASGGFGKGGSIANFGVLALNSCAFSNSFALGGDGGAGGGGGNAGNFAHEGQARLGGVGGEAQGGAIWAMGSIFASNLLCVGNSARAGNGGSGGNGADFHFGLGAPRSAAGTNGADSAGGAMYVGSNSIVVNSTFSKNFAIGGDGGAVGSSRSFNPAMPSGPGGNGGNAIGGGLANSGAGQLLSLTFSGNAAVSGLGFTNVINPFGGGIVESLKGTNGNSLGGSIANTGTLQIVNSILAGGSSNNCYGVITDSGHNISSDATPIWSSGTSFNNLDPLLVPLANNGGPTLTIALRVGSPALDSADAAASPATDQRGYPRPNGAGYDIGAYEGPGVPAVALMRESSATNIVRSLAEAGRSYRLDQTTNFNVWTPVATNSPTQGGLIDFRVPATSPSRFFRVTVE